MVDASSSIFNKNATQRLRSPDDLDKFVRVTNPNVWVVLAACLALLAGLLAWGVLGSVTTSVSSTGVSVGSNAMCFLTAEDAAKVHEGDDAFVGGEQMRVAKVAPIPVSRDEAGKILKSDYLVSTLMSGDWAYQVTFDGDTSELADGVPLTVSITVERIAPITLIFGSNA
ncbi:MAG: hypothetical protein IJI68_06600 [Eggerthellaceae bacterium]|nr:hypothetical protein [Eggerthellaceae bacterium]